MPVREPPSPRPAPFSTYTTPEFWDDPHVSAQMLTLHLDPDAEAASRPHAFVDRSVSWLVDVLGLQAGHRVLDLGCGPGVYAHRLARRGVSVLGLDASHRSVEHARAVARCEGLPAAFRVANYLVDDLGSGYDAALFVYEDFCALSPEQRGGLLRRTRDALRPGGAFVMDVTAAPRFVLEQPGERHEPDLDDGFWAQPPYEGTHETWTYPELRLVLDRYTITKDGRTRQFWNWLHCLTVAEVSDELVAAGFAAPDVHGDVTGAPFEPTSPVFAVVTHRV